MNETTHNPPPEVTIPGRDVFRAAAHSLQQQAEGKWKHAARSNTLLLILILAVSTVLAVPTGLVFINDLDWPAWLSLPIAFALHVFLAFFVHWAISNKKAEKIGAAAAFAGGAALLIIAFLVVAVLRANNMMDGGKSPLIAWIAALVYWLVECAIPIGLGVAFESASENAADERARKVRADDFSNMINGAGTDAAGAWTDAEARLQHELAAFDRLTTLSPDAVRKSDHKKDEQQRDWLNQLWEAHPGKRFADLKNSGKGAYPEVDMQEPQISERRGLSFMEMNNEHTHDLTPRDR